MAMGKSGPINVPPLLEAGEQHCEGQGLSEIACTWAMACLRPSGSPPPHFVPPAPRLIVFTSGFSPGVTASGFPLHTGGRAHPHPG